MTIQRLTAEIWAHHGESSGRGSLKSSHPDCLGMETGLMGSFSYHQEVLDSLFQILIIFVSIFKLRVKSLIISTSQLWASSLCAFSTLRCLVSAWLRWNSSEVQGSFRLCLSGVGLWSGLLWAPALFEGSKTGGIRSLSSLTLAHCVPLVTVKMSSDSDTLFLVNGFLS